MPEYLKLVSANPAPEILKVEANNNSRWMLSRSDDADEARLMVNGRHLGTVALWPADPEKQGWFAALLPDGRLIRVCDTFKQACAHAMVAAGTIATVPESLIEHFANHATILSTAPVEQADEAPEIMPTSPSAPAEYSAEPSEQHRLCAMVEDLLKARLVTIRDTSNDWPVVVTLGSFRPDLEQRARELLAAIGYTPTPLSI